MPVLKQAKIHYKKAEKIVTHAKLNAVRENPGAKHVSVSTLLPGTKKGQKSCVLCCALCATAKGEAKHRSGSHYRIGHNVTTKCIQCNVHLCEISRFLYKGESRTCWDIFHSCTPSEVTDFKQNFCSVKDTTVLVDVQIWAPESTTEKKKQALKEIRPKQFPKRSLEVLTVSPSTLKPVPQTPELPSQVTARQLLQSTPIEANAQNKPRKSEHYSRKCSFLECQALATMCYQNERRAFANSTDLKA